MDTTSRTINPLHFEDLEPHRFEDLVRQLIYDFRLWRSLEALGRLGADAGIDIRAIEQSAVADTEAAEDDEEPEDDTFVANDLPTERTWMIQCKREKSIPPKKITHIVADNLSHQRPAPYGYLLVAACDFSKAARDAFRHEVIKYGVQEFSLWGKAELEDMLFRPSNDHLLFAYFGISLQVRRRSMRTQLRSWMALKRKLVKELGSVKAHHCKPVLIVDPRDEEYPFLPQGATANNQYYPWRYWDFFEHMPPDRLVFVTRRFFAYVDWETKQWDALTDCDEAAFRHADRLSGARRSQEITEADRKYQRYRRYWHEKVPRANQGWATQYRFIPFNRILAVDEIGDLYNEGPHLLVAYRENGDPFEPGTFVRIESAGAYERRSLVPEKEHRIPFFPKEIPDLPAQDASPTGTGQQTS